MEHIEELVQALNTKNNETAYECLKQLQLESKKSNAVYKYFDRFYDMIKSENSYVRTRGLILISDNARWDKDNKIDEIIDEYMEHILDEKPITARKCIKSLPDIAIYKPYLLKSIINALKKADTSKYKSSMKSLVDKDISDVLRKISMI